MVPTILVDAEPSVLGLEAELGDAVAGRVGRGQVGEVVDDVEDIDLLPDAGPVVADGEVALDPAEVEVVGDCRVDEGLVVL